MSGTIEEQQEAHTNPYVLDPEQVKDPPEGFRKTLGFLGPGLILVGSIVGSGEIILTTALGALVGFRMLWFVLLSCWGKNIVQAELARQTLSSGEPVLQAFNRLPGKLPGPAGEVSWFIYVWLFSLIPGHMTGGGIYGGAGLAVHMALPFLASKWWTILLAAGAAGIILSGTYRFLEKLMTFMVVTFTFITVTCAILLQFTEYALTWGDVASGFRFEFPAFAISGALAMYGGTGVPAGESMNYTYWCVEKGYARFTGARNDTGEWVRRAKGWIRVMQTDVFLTIFLLTFATIPFYMLGAGVLNRLGVRPDGLETIAVLSNTYTQTLGDWAYWLFMVGAFFVLYSTAISGLAGGSRMFADGMSILGVFDRDDFTGRRRVIRVWAVLSPTIMATTYFFIENPVLMLTIGNIMGMFMTPTVAAVTIYRRYKVLDRRIAPSWQADVLLWVCLLIMIALAVYIFSIRFL